MIRRTTPPTGLNPKMASKFVGPYQIKRVLDLDRYVFTDIRGHQISHKTYENILPPERLKRWTLEDISDEDEDVEDEVEDEDAEDEVEGEDEEDENIENDEKEVNSEDDTEEDKRTKT